MCRRINPSYWQVVIIAMVAPFAGTFWDTSALATCTRNFPAERGTIIGIVKACMGKPCMHSWQFACLAPRLISASPRAGIERWHHLSRPWNVRSRVLVKQESEGKHGQDAEPWESHTGTYTLEGRRL